jgi:hypothetical protein
MSRVPRDEPEVIAAGATKHYHGDDDGVGTTALGRIMVRRVILKSRHGRPMRSRRCWS